MAEGNSGLGGVRMVLGGNPFGWTIDRCALYQTFTRFSEGR